LSLDAGDKGAGFVEWHILRGMVRLPKAVGESFDQVNSLPRQNAGRAFGDTQRDQRSPTRVGAESERCRFQKASVATKCRDITENVEG
jgi:hypothetical protein